MAIDITIPSPGESISEVVLGPWQKSSGDWVEKDEPLVEIESDKVTLEVPAAESGVLEITAQEGAELSVGDVIGRIDPDGERKSGGDDSRKAKPAGAASAGSSEKDGNKKKSEGASDERTSAAAVEVATATRASARADADEDQGEGARATPLARRVAADRGVPLTDVRGTGPAGRIRKSDVLAVSQTATAPADRSADADATADAASLPAVLPPDEIAAIGTRGVRREKMSRLRQRIAERLVQAQRNAAMLTTFNEADMSEVIRLRKLHKETFKERHGVGLGFMSFFVKACVSGLQVYEGVNAYIDGAEVEYHDYVDISVAVGTPRGLVVPVLRNAERLTFAQIEKGIADLATRARDGKLTMDDMTGGTFTISNGGVYGSLMSTPILNPPQSGILGMHRIMPRAVEDAANPGQIVLRPMMYLALSYDHRIVDGEQAVRFLVHVKECLESPERLLLGL